MSDSVYNICRQHDMNVEELSEQPGISHDRIMAIVLGRWTPSPTERTRIAAVSAIDPNFISWGHKTPIQPRPRLK